MNRNGRKTGTWTVIALVAILLVAAAGLALAFRARGIRRASLAAARRSAAVSDISPARRANSEVGRAKPEEDAGDDIEIVYTY